MITNEIHDLETATTLISDALDYSMKDGLFASIDIACLFSGGVYPSLIFLMREISKRVMWLQWLILESMMI